MPGSLAERLRPPEEVKLPPAHLGLRWAPLAPQHADELSTLIARSAEADDPVHPVSRGQLRRVLELAGNGHADAVGGRDRDGDLQAAAWVFHAVGTAERSEAFVGATIAPPWRGRGIGRGLLEWQDGRARQLLAAQGRDVPCRISAYVDEHAEDRRRLHVAGGFSLVGRYDVVRRFGAEPIPRPVSVAQVVPCRNADAEKVRALPERWTAREYGSGLEEPRWSVTAVERGSVVGAALTQRHDHEWPRPGFAEGFIEMVALAAGRADVARSLLAAVHELLVADGVDCLALEVRRGSAPAQTLTELGFQPAGTRLHFAIEV